MILKDTYQLRLNHAGQVLFEGPDKYTTWPLDWGLGEGLTF